MKKLHLFKTVFLLFALIVGSSSVWATLPQNPLWIATALSNISDGATVVIISNSTTATNIALPSTATTSSPAKKACTVTTTDGVTTIAPPTGTTLQDLAWTLKKESESYKFFQEGSSTIRLYLNGTGSNTALRVGDAESNNDTFVMGGAGKLLKVTTAARYVGPYDNNGSDWRTYNSETATNYKDAALTFYVLQAAPSYTITPTVNDEDMGSAVLSGLRIIATPNDGYRVKAGAEGYTVTLGSATVTNNGDNTFTVSTSEDCTVQINFEAIPTYTLSGVVSPVGAAGDVELGTTSIREGGNTTATAASANPGYKFTGWSISGTGASLSSTTDNPTTVTIGTSNATITANYEAVTTFAISYSVNGVIIDTQNVEEDAAVDLSAPESGIPSGYVFRGWSASEILTPQATEAGISYVSSATSTADITYYAVMAIEVGVSAPTLTKMVKGDTFVAGDKIVIVAHDTNYGLYQETTNSSYVKNFSFDGEVESIAADDKTWLTVTAGSNGKWILGDATNGYLYSSSSNNLAVNTSNSSQWTLEDKNDGTFSLTQGRYLSCRSDLSGTNQYLYRLAGSSPSGIFVFDIYKYVLGSPIYSNYCTTVPTATVSIASACKDDVKFYGTYSNSSAFIVPEGLTVSEIGIVENKLYVEDYAEGDIVPANTGVMISATSAGEKTLTLAAGGSSKLGEDNCLKASGDDGIDAVAMAAAAPSCKYYRLTMHEGTQIGFWWGAEDGAAFSIAANKAYLAVPSGIAARSFWFDEGETTAINAALMNNERMNNEVYNLNGQRVTQPTKGLYIVNGRKVVIK